MFKDIKGKGFDRQKVKSKVPKELKKVNQSKKPEITLNFSDYFNRFKSWFMDATDYVIKKAFSNMIPDWFFVALLVVAIVIVLVVVL